MVSDSSLPTVGGFNLDTQKGVMQLLVGIRGAELTPAEKADFRDLVFLYTNGGRDNSVRLSLEQRIVRHQLVPPTPTPTAPVHEVPRPVIGTFRSTPSFVVPSVTPQPAATPVPVPVPPPVVPVVNPDPIAAAVAAPVFVPPVVAPPPIQPEPVFSVPIINESQPLPVEPPAAQVVYTETNDTYLNRIREIKASVNEKVGNPVNLVDINNDVGREYMGALLDAMKKLNTGSSAGVAMQRLEAAYASVLSTLDARSVLVSQPTTPPVSQPIEADTEIAQPIIKTAPPVATYTPPPAVPVAKVMADETFDVPYSTPKTGKLPVATVESGGNVPPAPHDWTPLGEAMTPVSAPAAATFTSLADLKPLETQVAAAPLYPTTPVAMGAEESLFTDEVDEGLDQLLGEWSLFKKSGIFGSGPKGKEHPLFKKIAPLHIPLLLAGRFEGATQEIRQSITDYMNGWRYEQGLIYQQGETFEHYLRRVIRHILDLQKG